MFQAYSSLTSLTARIADLSNPHIPSGPSNITAFSVIVIFCSEPLTVTRPLCGYSTFGLHPSNFSLVAMRIANEMCFLAYLSHHKTRWDGRGAELLPAGQKEAEIVLFL